jgi:hypothetical protein
VLPTNEACGDGLDNDCDAQIDENCVCAPGSNAPCYDGPAGTEGVGECRRGTQSCNGDGSGFEACLGSVTPSAETCGDGLDNNCDGIVDDRCVCDPNTTAVCYDGPAGTDGVGTCTAGSKVCNPTGTSYSECTGAITPEADVCGDQIDTDCDGAADEGCVCAPNSTALCYSGASETLDIGTCVSGSKQCASDGLSYGACAGEDRDL